MAIHLGGNNRARKAETQNSWKLCRVEACIVREEAPSIIVWLSSNISSATYQFCEFGKLLNLSELQFICE